MYSHLFLQLQDVIVVLVFLHLILLYTSLQLILNLCLSLLLL